MITVEEFANRIEEEFELLEPGSLLPDTDYRGMEEWDSMHALILIALVDTEFDVRITGNDIKSSTTVRDIYQLVLDRKE